MIIVDLLSDSYDTYVMHMTSYVMHMVSCVAPTISNILHVVSYAMPKISCVILMMSDVIPTMFIRDAFDANTGFI